MAPKSREGIFVRRLLCVLAFGVLILVSCGGSEPEPTQTPTPIPSPAPTDVPTPDPCPSAEVEAFADAIAELHSEFRDTWRVAEATPRVSLSPLVLELQHIRNRTAEMDYPSCLALSFQSELNGMDLVLEGFLAFMADEPDCLAGLYFEEVPEAFALAAESMQEVESGGAIDSSECRPEEVREALGDIATVLDSLEELRRGGSAEMAAALDGVDVPLCMKGCKRQLHSLVRWAAEEYNCSGTCRYEELRVAAYTRILELKLKEAEAQLIATNQLN